MMGDTQDILLVEDSPSQALRFWLLLSCLGYEVCLANDGKDGLDKALHVMPKLILLDLNLPSLHGLEVLSRLKSNHATACIPVCILSDSENAQEVQQALALGAENYLFKRDFFKNDAACRLQEKLSSLLVPAAHNGVHNGKVHA